jgi:hypothetical protein
MDAFQFRKLLSAPADDHTVSVFRSGTQDLVGLKSLTGEPLPNPFTIAAAGGEAHWGFVPDAGGLVDVWWANGGVFLAVRAEFGTYDVAGAASSVIASHEGQYNHSAIGHTNRAALDAVAGVNTGDQDLSGLAPADHAHSEYEPTGTAAGAIAAHVLSPDAHPEYTKPAEAAMAAPVQSVAGKTGNVTLVPGDVGAAPAGHAHSEYEPTGTAAGAVAAHVLSPDAHPDYTTPEEAAMAAPVQSVAGKTGNVTLVPGDVGAEPANPNLLKKTDIHDSPQDGAVNVPISSNWARDHSVNKDHLPAQAGQDNKLLTTVGGEPQWIEPPGVWATVDEAIAMSIALG